MEFYEQVGLGRGHRCEIERRWMTPLLTCGARFLWGFHLLLHGYVKKMGMLTDVFFSRCVKVTEINDNQVAQTLQEEVKCCDPGSVVRSCGTSRA